MYFGDRIHVSFDSICLFFCRQVSFGVYTSLLVYIGLFCRSLLVCVDFSYHGIHVSFDSICLSFCMQLSLGVYSFLLVCIRLFCRSLLVCYFMISPTVDTSFWMYICLF